MPVPALDGSPELSDRDLARIMQLVYEKSGIALHAGKRALVTARLQKRVRQGGFRNFHEYVRYVLSDASGDELTALLDAIATNHTSFFREPQHFEFLRQVALPPLVARQGPILGWSAACATGEEPYSIAMTLVDGLNDDAFWRVRLLASDLSTKALTTARAAVYKADRVGDLPVAVRHRFFEQGVASQRGFVRVGTSIRTMVEFRQLNLLELPPLGVPFDFIFCRNVMIYFDRPTQQRVMRSLEQRLAPGGYLFISHAESLSSIRHGLISVAPAVYRRVSR